MNPKLNRILLAAAPAEGGAPAETDRSVKSSMVKVRATGQPLNVDGVHVGNGPKDSAEIPASRLASLGGMVTKVAAIAALLLLGSLAAPAQQYTVTSLPMTNGSSIRLTGSQTNGIGGALAAGATNQLNVVIPVTKWDDISLFFGSTPQAASTSNNIVYLDQSLTGSNHWFTLGQVAWVDNGTTASGNGTNIVIKATGYIRVTQWASPTSLVIKSNLVAEYSFKPLRFGN